MIDGKWRTLAEIRETLVVRNWDLGTPKRIQESGELFIALRPGAVVIPPLVYSNTASWSRHRSSATTAS